MRTLKNHLILYDAECPMCQLYTHAFTRTHMLDSNGRAPYQTALAAEASPLTPACPLIDRDRAVNEIALINTETGEVTYGIHSLFKIIAHSFPLLKPLFTCRPFITIMRKVYAFISYNRKVIIPAPQTTTLKPAFKLNYRIAWLLFTTIIAASILTRYTDLLTGILPPGGPWREYLICGGQIGYQGMIVTLYAPDKKWDYLGNMMTISLAGSLALLPALTIPHLFPANSIAHYPMIATAWFGIVATGMLLEHIRRTKLLGLDWTLSISWIFYRLVVLFLILR